MSSGFIKPPAFYLPTVQTGSERERKHPIARIKYLVNKHHRVTSLLTPEVQKPCRNAESDKVRYKPLNSNSFYSAESIERWIGWQELVEIKTHCRNTVEPGN